MDQHVRWLRRFLVSRIAVRLFAECCVVAIAVFYGTRVAELGLVLGLVASMLAAQVFALVRVVAALNGNPVNHRYLMGWDDTSALLEPVESKPSPDDRLGAMLGELGFQPLVRLGRTGTDDAVAVYASTARLVLVSSSREGEPLVILSRLSDGRLLVTTRELLPPHEKVVVNQNRRSSIGELVESHVEMLEVLRRNGLHVIEAGPEAVVEQLHVEWEAWSQLGPFFGPFLAVGRRPQPLLLLARVPEVALWERTSKLIPQTWSPESELVDDPPTLRLVEAA